RNCKRKNSRAQPILKFVSLKGEKQVPVYFVRPLLGRVGKLRATFVTMKIGRELERNNPAVSVISCRNVCSTPTARTFEKKTLKCELITQASTHGETSHPPTVSTSGKT